MPKKNELNRFNRITKCDSEVLRFMMDGVVYTLDRINAEDFAFQLDRHLIEHNRTVEK